MCDDHPTLVGPEACGAETCQTCSHNAWVAGLGDRPGPDPVRCPRPVVDMDHTLVPDDSADHTLVDDALGVQGV